MATTDYLMDSKMVNAISTTQKPKSEKAKKSKAEAKTYKKSIWKKMKKKSSTISKQLEKTTKFV